MWGKNWTSKYYLIEENAEFQIAVDVSSSILNIIDLEAIRLPSRILRLTIN
jgi:hypothetical protein